MKRISLREEVTEAVETAGNNTQAMIEKAKDYPLHLVDALLIASPYYNKPSQTGILAHYKLLADELPDDIILYNVPGRTGSNLSAETTLTLANECENIIAIKEASGDLFQMAQIIKNKPSDFAVLSGDDDLALHQMSMGADGIVSVTANAYPKRFSAFIKSSGEGDLIAAREHFNQFLDIIPLLFKEGNPEGIKALMNILGLLENDVRLPLVAISDELRNEIYRAASDAGLTN